MHRSKHDSSVLNTSEDVFRSVVPINSQSINWAVGVVFSMKEFHDSGKVVRLSRRLTDKVDMVYMKVSTGLEDGGQRALELSPFACTTVPSSAIN